MSPGRSSITPPVKSGKTSGDSWIPLARSSQVSRFRTAVARLPRRPSLFDFFSSRDHDHENYIALTRIRYLYILSCPSFHVSPFTNSPIGVSIIITILSIPSDSRRPCYPLYTCHCHSIHRLPSYRDMTVHTCYVFHAFDAG
jgi:hypothetical protein